MRNKPSSQYNSTNNDGGKGKQSNSKFSKSINSSKGKWNNNNNKKTSYTKTKEKKFAHMVTGPSHYATYDEVLEDFCNYVQKT